MDTTRIELDLPVVIVNQYGKLVLDNLKDIEDVISASFPKGTVLSLHIIAEDTGKERGFCKHINQSSSYKSACGFVLNAAGLCIRQEEHDKEDIKQLELAATDESEGSE